MQRLKRQINGFMQYKHLLLQLVERDIKLKYRRSFLGYVWSILNPLMIMIIMVAVFSSMFRFDIVNYPVYLIIGQTIFNFVSESTNQAMWSITGNASLLKKTYVPKYIFTLSKVTSSCVNTLFSLGAMVLVFLVCHVKLNWYMLFIPIIIIQVYVFCVGMGMFLSQATVFFRDIQYIYAAFVTAWMYLTPMFYPISIIPDNIKTVIYYNPLYYYVTYLRMLVIDGEIPGMEINVICICFSFLFLLIGLLIFKKNQDKFILYI